VRIPVRLAETWARSGVTAARQKSESRRSMGDMG
jgi:hypothetical protein